MDNLITFSNNINKLKTERAGNFRFKVPIFFQKDYKKKLP